MKLSAYQRRLLRQLNHPNNSFGIETSGRWTATGNALVKRGLATASGGRHFSITEKGRTEQAEWAARGFGD